MREESRKWGRKEWEMFCSFFFDPSIFRPSSKRVATFMSAIDLRVAGVYTQFGGVDRDGFEVVDLSF